jgi:hypothetical protein
VNTSVARGRPGLAKTRGLPLVTRTEGTVLRATDPKWRDLFGAADVVSEGGARREGAGRVWYGSTSLILRTEPEEAEMLARVAARDVHVRLRAMRAAHREACLRAPAPLGRIVCELRFGADPGGVRIDVDVQAPLIERRASSRSFT